MRFDYVQYDETVTSDYTVEHARLGYYITIVGKGLGEDRYVNKNGTVWSFMGTLPDSREGGTYISTKEEAESLLASLLGAQK